MRGARVVLVLSLLMAFRGPTTANAEQAPTTFQMTVGSGVEVSWRGPFDFAPGLTLLRIAPSGVSAVPVAATTGSYTETKLEPWICYRLVPMTTRFDIVPSYPLCYVAARTGQPAVRLSAYVKPDMCYACPVGDATLTASVPPDGTGPLTVAAVPLWPGGTPQVWSASRGVYELTVDTRDGPPSCYVAAATMVGGGMAASDVICVLR